MERWGYTYERAQRIYRNLEPRSALYFDERSWSADEVKEFFQDLQREDNDLWCYFSNSLKTKVNWKR